jgi:hypothetical protein
LYSSSGSSSEEEVDCKKKLKSKTKDSKQIDDLVTRLSKLSRDDPSYALLFFQALKIDSTIGEVFLKPMRQGNFNTAPQGIQRPPGGQFTPTYPNNIRLGPAKFTCYGCGGNHRLTSCPEINSLIDKAWCNQVK